MTAAAATPLEGFRPSAASAAPLEPVEIMLERDHPFAKKKADPVTGRKRIGCGVCGRGRHHRDHMGAPPSLNDGGSGMDRMAYQALKKAWQSAFVELLAASGLPRGLDGVSVEGLVGFPTRAARDQGNYRWMIEKALGDAMQDLGVIADDCFFPVCRYEFGGLQAVHTPGRSWLRLMIFPRAVDDR